jgi:hypothetical protein
MKKISTSVLFVVLVFASLNVCAQHLLPKPVITDHNGNIVLSMSVDPKEDANIKEVQIYQGYHDEVFADPFVSTSGNYINKILTESGQIIYTYKDPAPSVFGKHTFRIVIVYQNGDTQNLYTECTVPTPSVEELKERAAKQQVSQIK